MLRFLAYFVLMIGFVWWLLTLYVQQKGPEAHFELTPKQPGQPTALFIYDPDPFYDLDDQVCRALAETYIDHGWHCTIQTVRAAEKDPSTDYDLYAFCANTYNWAPDRAVANFIKKHPALKDKSALAITVGGGSTNRAKRLLNKIIQEKDANLIGSTQYWLWRPNDESRMEESNVRVAQDMIKEWGANMLDNTSLQ